MVTVLLLAMVVGALLPLLTSGQQGFDYARRRGLMIRNGRVALDKLIRYLLIHDYALSRSERSTPLLLEIARERSPISSCLIASKW